MYLPISRTTVVVFTLPVIAMIVIAGCVRSSPPAPPPPSPVAVAPAAVSDYVGSEACGKCHPDEAARHGRTNHAHTFHPMTVSALGKLAPEQTLFEDINAAVAIDADHYLLVNPKTRQTRPLEYAIGSGKQGMTYTAAEPGGVFEMRFSYIPRTHDWYPTPGQEAEANRPNATGKLWNGKISRACVLCHAVKVADDGYYPAPRFMGVGCESCHGPGGAHIDAVNSGARSDLKMEHLTAANSDRVEAVCARCHRSSAEVAAMPAKARVTQRFMIYGLEQSRCFQESRGRLNCLTCHDPHTDASTDHKFYARICLQCHAGAATALTRDDRRPAATISSPEKQPRSCPINPRSGCIDCHMPTKSVFGGNRNRIPIAMADHWIRINRR